MCDSVRHSSLLQGHDSLPEMRTIKYVKVTKLQQLNKTCGCNPDRLKAGRADCAGNGMRTTSEPSHRYHGTRVGPRGRNKETETNEKKKVREEVIKRRSG